MSCKGCGGPPGSRPPWSTPEGESSQEARRGPQTALETATDAVAQVLPGPVTETASDVTEEAAGLPVWAWVLLGVVVGWLAAGGRR